MNATSAADGVPLNPPEESLGGREWSRIQRANKENRVPIQLPGGVPQEALLLDNSFGGLGLALEQADGFQVGDEVAVIFNAAPMRAYIRQKRQMPEGYWKLGLQWKD